MISQSSKKKLWFLSIIIFVFFGLAIMTSRTAFSFCDDPTTVNLSAGQNIEVGTVTAYNDENNIYITYITTGGWVLSKTHVALATALSHFPKLGSEQELHGSEHNTDLTEDQVDAF